VLRWAKKSERRGPVWEFARKTHIGLPRPTGRIEEMNMKGPEGPIETVFEFI
jgi:hypothetical protein